MVTFWLTNFVESALDVAVIVTELLAGMTAGAVYVITALSAVCAGLTLNDPQLPPVAAVQLTDQFTPFGGFALSFRTLALICAVAPTTRDVGGCSVNVIERAGVFTVTLALMAALGFAVGAACMVTCRPAAGT